MFPKIRGYLFGGPYNQDYSVLGDIGFPLFWETTICRCYIVVYRGIMDKKRKLLFRV